MGRKIITISIDQKTYEILKNNAKRHGDISHLIEDAVYFYFSTSHTPTRFNKVSDKKITTGNNKAYEIYLSILNFLKQEYYINYPDTKKIPMILLHRTIGNLFGWDKRTITKYIDIISPYIIIKNNEVELK